jgi:hypothetical protein
MLEAAKTRVCSVVDTAFPECQGCLAEPLSKTIGRAVETSSPVLLQHFPSYQEIPMTAPLSAEPYRAKVWKNKRGETYFALVYCPASDLEFHLLWPVALLTYPEKKTVYLKCPGCKHSFTSLDLPIGKVVLIAAGCEHFPAAAAASWSVVSVCRSGNATTPKETSNSRK